jgi:hypothetical protein
MGPVLIILRNDRIALSIDGERGAVHAIAPAADPGLNYIANHELIPAIDTPDPRWFADLVLRTRSAPGSVWRREHTGASRDIRMVRETEQGVTVKYLPPSTKLNGLRTAAVTTRFALQGGAVAWEIELYNPMDCDLEIGDLALCMPWNMRTDDVPQQEIYSRRCNGHSFIAGHSSYILAQRLDGVPPYLLIVPAKNTHLEAWTHEKAEGFAGAGVGHGVDLVYVHSLGAFESEGWKRWWHGHTCARLSAGEMRTHSFRLHLVDSYDEVRDVLLEEEKVYCRVVPGMVVPEGAAAHLVLESARRVLSVSAVEPEGASVTAAGSSQSRGVTTSVYRIRLNGRGPRTVRIEYTRNRWMQLVFHSGGDIETLIRARAGFIARCQQVTDPGDDMHGAFMMWDAETNSRVREARLPYFTGGSDELGFADPLFLAQKNVIYPEPAEIAALERYIEHFLFGKIQDREGYGVRLWWGDEPWKYHRGSDIDRSYNYPHVFNIYFAMYRIARLYGATRIFEANDYLRMAWRTAMAFYTVPMCWSSGDAKKLGNMGAARLPAIIAALREEGMAEEADELEAHVRESAGYFSREPYPYASEFNFDTTGYDTVYRLRRLVAPASLPAVASASPPTAPAGGPDDAIDETCRHNAAQQELRPPGPIREHPRNPRSVLPAPTSPEATLNVILATRGKQPIWFHYGGDVRWGFGNAKYPESEAEVCFNYMTGLNALPLLDGYWRSVLAGSPDRLLLEIGYAGLLATWALVRDSGLAYYAYDPEPERMFWDPWTSEMGLGIWATLFGLGSYVVEDPVLGLVGYGCDVKRDGDAYVVEPHDGVDQRILVAPLRARLTITCGTIARAIFRGGPSCQVTLRNGSTYSMAPTIRFEWPIGSHEHTIALDAGQEATVLLPAAEEPK